MIFYMYVLDCRVFIYSLKSRFNVNWLINFLLGLGYVYIDYNVCKVFSVNFFKDIILVKFLKIVVSVVSIVFVNDGGILISYLGVVFLI